MLLRSKTWFTMGSMSAVEFKKWMKDRGLTEVDVAAALKCSPVTVVRFLKGKSVLRSTLASFERFVRDYDAKRAS